jgi:hypothetical protein
MSNKEKMLKKKPNKKFKPIIKKYKIKNLFIIITTIKYIQNKSKKLIKEENDFNLKVFIYIFVILCILRQMLFILINLVNINSIKNQRNLSCIFIR